MTWQKRWLEEFELEQEYEKLFNYETACHTPMCNVFYDREMDLYFDGSGNEL